MKKRLLLVTLVCILVVSYLQFGRSTKVVSTFNSTSQNTTEVYVTVMANKLFVANKIKYCQELLNQYHQNSFSNIYISKDLSGNPEKIYFTVYENILMYKLKKHSFIATYHLKDNSGNYVLDIN